MLIDREVVSSTFEQATTRNSQVAKTFIAARGLPYHILHTVPGTVVISLYQAVCRKLIFAVRGTISTDWYFQKQYSSLKIKPKGIYRIQVRQFRCAQTSSASV